MNNLRSRIPAHEHGILDSVIDYENGDIMKDNEIAQLVVFYETSFDLVLTLNDKVRNIVTAVEELEKLDDFVRSVVEEPLFKVVVTETKVMLFPESGANHAFDYYFSFENYGFKSHRSNQITFQNLPEYIQEKKVYAACEMFKNMYHIQESELEDE
jgi:hypothetical protein